jgi:hypothetical protein
MTALTSVTNDLLLKYDENFNELYDKILTLNKSITNKEEILVKERIEMKSKDLNIEYLYSIIIFIILLGVLLIAHATNKIDTSKLIASTLLLLLLLLLYCYILYKRSIEVTSFVKKALVNMGDLSSSLIKQTFKNPYTCPANCPAIETEEESEPTINKYSTNISISPTLNTDPQNNVWKYGNRGYIDPKTNQWKDGEGGGYIKPLKGKSLTYYECKWLGGDINGNSLPIQDSNKYSTIPCTYKSNYTELNKFICDDDPNKNGVENCSKF